MASTKTLFTTPRFTSTRLTSPRFRSLRSIRLHPVRIGDALGTVTNMYTPHSLHSTGLEIGVQKTSL